MSQLQKATILRFITTSGGYFLKLKKPNEQESILIMDPQVALKLGDIYGVRSPSNCDRSSMTSLAGAACQYRVSPQFMITEVKVLPN